MITIDALMSSRLSRDLSTMTLGQIETEIASLQQVTIVRVEASSPKEAIAVAESVTDEDTWNVEKCIGVHAPEVKRTRP